MFVAEGYASVGPDEDTDVTRVVPRCVGQDGASQTKPSLNPQNHLSLVLIAREIAPEYLGYSIGPPSKLN